MIVRLHGREYREKAACATSCRVCTVASTLCLADLGAACAVSMEASFQISTLAK